MIRGTFGASLIGLSVCCGVFGAEREAAGPIELAKAAQVFREFGALCAEDGGKLWGVSLCGPLLLVDPSTRSVVGNRADASGALKPRAGVFVGELPGDVGIANTAVDWGGTRWTMLMWWSLGEDRRARSSLMAHEAFHRVQPRLGLETFGDINAHLDTADGRYWMQLEWNALERALSAEADSCREAIADALAFRAARRAHFPDAAEREVPLEIFEGLAEYTGMRLAGYSPERVVDVVSGKRAGETGFVRSFAYVSGPLYGFLLDRSGAEWRRRVGADTDLGAMLAEAWEIPVVAPPDEAARRAAGYGGRELLASEAEREAERAERLATWRRALIDGPVLIVDLSRVSSGSFDPHRVFPFDEGKTVYTVRELIADWGVLTVDDGAILEDDATHRGHVSLSAVTSGFGKGDGWTLELSEGWAVVPADRAGDFAVREAASPRPSGDPDADPGSSRRP